MSKKLTCLALGALLLALSFYVKAQQPAKVHRVGVLSSIPPSSSSPRLEAFRQGLRELGYVEGQNIVIEERSSEGQTGRLDALAAERVHKNVEVILTAGTSPTQSAKNTASKIPIVMTFVSDPVGFGFVASLALAGWKHHGLD